MKIAIFGGTFDPVHNAHMIIAQYAKEQYDIDRLIFMPGGNPPHKKNVTDKKFRYEMTKLAIGDNFEISDFEVNREEYSYSLFTLQAFKKKYPQNDIYFIIGEDSLDDIQKWYKPEEILKLCKLLVFPRKNYEELCKKIKNTKAALGGEIFAIDAPIFGISSTQIRNRIKEGKRIEYMVPPKVAEYIKENELYK